MAANLIQRASRRIRLARLVRGSAGLDRRYLDWDSEPGRVEGGEALFGPDLPTGSYARVVGGLVEVLCFDRWSDGLVEAWTVSLPPEDFAWQVRAAREGALHCATQDLLAGYDSEHFDAGTAGYLRLAAEAARGEWAPLAPLEAPLPARAAASGGRRLDFGGTAYLGDFAACADVPGGWLSPGLAGDYSIFARAYDTSALEDENERVAQAAGLAYDCFVWVGDAVTGDLEGIARFLAEDRLEAEASLEAVVAGLAREQVRDAVAAIERRRRSNR